VLDNAARLGVLPQSRHKCCGRQPGFIMTLTQILRPLRQQRFRPETSGEDSVAGDGAGRRRPGFFIAASAGEETQTEVRRVFLAFAAPTPASRAKF